MEEKTRAEQMAELQESLKAVQDSAKAIQDALKRLKIEERVEKKTAREQPKGKATVALTQEQYREIIETMRTGFTGFRPNDRIATALVLEANFGVRISDIVLLQMDRIIRDGDRWRLNAVEKKTGRPRTFTVPAELYMYIEHYCLKNNIRPDEEIFPITTRSVQRQLKKVCDWLGYKERISTHSFRKYYATRMYLQNGKDIVLVQTLLQHASPETTQKYIGIRPEAVENAISNGLDLI